MNKSRIHEGGVTFPLSKALADQLGDVPRIGSRTYALDVCSGPDAVVTGGANSNDRT